MTDGRRTVWPLAALAALTVASAGCGTTASIATAESTDRPEVAPRDGYVSSIACRACHPDNYASWHGSYHRRMTQVATRQTVAAELDGVELRAGDHRYRFDREGDRYWVEIDEGAGLPAERRPIVMTTGSHHRQWLWFALGVERKLGTLPFVYLIDQERWIPRPAAFMLPPDPRWTPSHHEGLWGKGCISCHTTHGERRSANVAQARVAELGIACEACHGPAEAHVRINRDPLRRYGLYLTGAADDTVINPALLPHPRSSEVCGQCHSINAAKGAFRPGDDLVASFGDENRADPLPAASRWPDGMIHTGGREYDALIDTPCFRQGEMSCHSCHTMHRTADDPRPLASWADDQLGHGMESDAACNQCHADVKAHSHHLPESSGSRCYNCHMPHTSYALLKAIRNHQVTPPSVATTVATGRPNACNLCHLDRSLGWTADHLARWYEIPRPELTPDQERLSSAVLWAMTGHAGQRALIGWHMGWKPAQEASGSLWLTPYLTLLLNDPYPAVRIIANRSLRTIPGFATFEVDDVGPAEARQAALARAVQLWRDEIARSSETGDAILIGPDGSLRQAEFLRLVGIRDDRPVFWIE